MADDDPTMEDLQRQIDQLVAEMEEILEESLKTVKMAKAIEHMAQRLATIHGDPLADWWWL